MIRFVSLSAALLLAAGPAFAARKWEGPAVRVILVAAPPAEAEMQERRVGPRQPFMVHRLIARKSVTLQSDVVVKFWHRTARFAQGAQLFQASGADGFEVYCGVFDPGLFIRSSGGSKIQYACLQDLDGDGVFDKGYWTPDNPGADLPVFNKVIAGPDMKAAYKPDAEADRLYFESAFILAKGGKPDGPLIFLEQVRRPGDADWKTIISIVQTKENKPDGGTVSVTTTKATSVVVSSDALPRSAELTGARFTVVSRDAAGVTIKPESAASGERILDTYEYF